jgi:hypothetical protein
MVFHLNIFNNIFRSLLCHVLPNSAILKLQIFSVHGKLFGASFGLFSRKFTHLTPVLLCQLPLLLHLQPALLISTFLARSTLMQFFPSMENCLEPLLS